MSKHKRPDTCLPVQAGVGQRIKWAREITYPNRSDLARLMEVDRTTLQKIEDGCRAPSIFQVLDFARLLGVTTEYLLTGSLRGVEGEMAGQLAAYHPELVGATRSPGAALAPPRPKMKGRLPRRADEASQAGTQERVVMA